MNYYLVLDLAKVQNIGDEVSGIASGNRPKVVYHSESSATEAAQELAELAPKHQIAVLKAEVTFETTKPSFTKKKFNSSGELIPT